MNIKTELFLYFLVFCMLSIFLFSAKKGTAVDESKIETSIYMNPEKNTLLVTDQSEKSGSDKINRIFFKDRDYTKFAKDLMGKYPLAFASCRFLIFGKESVKLIKDQWKCEGGIIFIPGEKEIRFIDATCISYNEKKQILKAKNAKIEKLSLDMKHKEEKEEAEMTVDFSKI